MARSRPGVEQDLGGALAVKAANDLQQHDISSHGRTRKLQTATKAQKIRGNWQRLKNSPPWPCGRGVVHHQSDKRLMRLPSA